MKNNIKILAIIVSLCLFLLLAGCISSNTDKAKIILIAKNIEKSIEKKNVDLFMQNISYDYSDSKGGTYDNHINDLPEKMFLKIEEAEDLIDIYPLLKIEVKVTIPENDLVLADIYASGNMKIKISLKACVVWIACATLYNENIEYDVNFIKENDDWKIIFMQEIE